MKNSHHIIGSRYVVAPYRLADGPSSHNGAAAHHRGAAAAFLRILAMVALDIDGG
jgi:hypothetical protein